MISKMIKTLAIGCFLMVAGINGKAQTTQELLEDIYKKYDSLLYITFDIKYTYNSDTVLGDFMHDELEGTYTMAGKKAFYKLGNIQFMQNDSALVAVYNEDKFILVSDPKLNNTGSLLPLRQMIDSLVQAYSSHYTITNNTSGDTGKILFVKTDSIAQFEHFSISYNINEKVIYQVEYEFIEPPYIDPEVIYAILPVGRRKSLSVDFLRYRFENLSDQVYDINNYIFYEHGTWKPIDKYEDYQVYYNKQQ